MMNLARIGARSSSRVGKIFQNVPSFKGFATVAENAIKITFVDGEGNRATVPARIGRTLLEEAQLHGVDLEGSCDTGGGDYEIQRTEKWVEQTFGEGPMCFHCHVQIPSSFNHVLPRIGENEIDGLKYVWEGEYNVTSRLACMITLEKKHDGLVVFVPDAPPVDLV